MTVSGNRRRPYGALLLSLAMVSALLTTPVSAHAAAVTADGAFVSVEPARLLDTRDGTGGFSGAVPSGGIVSLKVTGVGGVPASGVAAVSLNTTVTSPGASGFITLYPSGSARPVASNLNFVTGQTIPNLVTVKVGGDGRVNLYNGSGATVHLIADVAGYYRAGTPTVPGAFVPVEPARLLDTRDGTGYSGAVPAGGTVSLQITGRGGVPTTGVGAVVLNTTVTGPGSSGFITVYPSGASKPLASSLNFVAGQTVPNLVTVKVGGDGKVNLYNGSGATVHLVADVAGYYLSGTPTVDGAFVPLEPMRVLDTRDGTGFAGAVPPGGTVSLQVATPFGVPGAGVAAVVLNTTVTSPGASGFITAYPQGSAKPTASNLNFVAGLTIPNQVTVKVGSTGRVNLYNGSGAYVHLIADVAGYFLDTSLDINWSSFPDGVAGTPYPSITLYEANANLPTSWSATGLPPGLTLSPVGILSGTPTVGGTFTVTVTLTDGSMQTATVTDTLVVATPEVALTSPPGNTDWDSQLFTLTGGNYTANWQVPDDCTLSIWLMDAGNSPWDEIVSLESYHAMTASNNLYDIPPGTYFVNGSGTCLVSTFAWTLTLVKNPAGGGGARTDIRLMNPNGSVVWSSPLFTLTGGSYTADWQVMSYCSVDIWLQSATSSSYVDVLTIDAQLHAGTGSTGVFVVPGGTYYATGVGDCNGIALQWYATLHKG